MNLSANFTLGEFQAASDRAITTVQVRKAQAFVDGWLQPLREAMGFPVVITSFVRSGVDSHSVGSPPHADGDSVDFVPQSREPADLRRMRDWLDQRGGYGELLYEVTPYHLHMTLPGFHGDMGQALDEDPDNPDHYTARIVNFVSAYQKPIIGTLIVLLLVLIVLKGERS